MTPAAIIQKAQSAGVRLTLSLAGTIKATGDGVAVNRWLPVIREHKAEIIGVLKVVANAAVKPLSLSMRHPPTLMTFDEETAIRAWLAMIEETDPVAIAEVIDQCQRDAEVCDYFIGRAAELPNTKGGE